MKVSSLLFTSLLLPLLLSCSSAPAEKPQRAPAASQVLQKTPPTVAATAKSPAVASADAAITIYSPYSSEGLLALNNFRSNNSTLNDFLVRNRKPDYFFSGLNTEFSYQKIYLVYLESENLYLFDSTLKEPYKKFHPLPESIQKHFKDLMPVKPAIPMQAAFAPSDIQNNSDEMAYPNGIEKNLALSKPEPYLKASLLYQVPREGNNSSTLYPDLYFLDMPLSDLLENQYSAKYDGKKHILKLIFPKSYESGILYNKADTETRKIFVENNGNGNELALVVPDFLPGSDFYRSAHGNISKVFSSLYQVHVPANFTDSNQLHMRYSIKLCQSDAISHCAVRKNQATYIRAIVIEATLYDYKTKLPIETFVLK